MASESAVDTCGTAVRTVRRNAPAASFISSRTRHPTEIFSPPALTVPVRSAVAPDRIVPPPSSTPFLPPPPPVV